MALIDLKSDLSKYRAPASSKEVSTPNPSPSPVTDQISQFLGKTKFDDIKKPVPKSVTTLLSKTYLDDIEQPIKTNVVTRLTTTSLDNIQKIVTASLFSKLDSTKLDDVVKLDPKRPKLVDRYASRKPADDSSTYRSSAIDQTTSVLVNAVSNLSPSITSTSTFSNPIQLEEITSALSTINKTDFISNFDAPSNIKINKPKPGENNTESFVDITRSVLSNQLESTSPEILKDPREQTNNIVNPEIQIPIPQQSTDRQEESLVVNKDLVSPIGNITNPSIKIERKPLSINRETQGFDFEKQKVFPNDDVVNPEIEIIKPAQSFDRKSQSPEIISQVPLQGLVVDPKIKVLRIDQSSIHFEDESNFNIDKLPIRYTAVSELEKMVDEIIFNPIRYGGNSIQEKDNSELNLDTKPKVNLGGRHEDPSESNYSILGYQEVNFFSNRFAIGFTYKQQIGDSKFFGNSQFSWIGPTESSPFTNFFSDANARGFRTFMDGSETLYLTNSSLLGFIKPSGVNYFDGGKKNTTGGFTLSAMPSMTEYKTESSRLGWAGNKEAAPVVNFFDIGAPKTKDGFTKFQALGDSQYIPDSSDYNWDGNAQVAPAVNYFDLTGKNTTAGFHQYAGFLDSKYISDSSDYNWDGATAFGNVPTVNYFDMMGLNTTSGFTSFAQLGLSEYINDSSIFQWTGNSENAPAVNFFDVGYNFTDEGFHIFAQKGITQYIEESSGYTWRGSREDNRGVNFFDLTKKNTTDGFHSLAVFGETKYIHESSTYTWKGNAQKPPTVNYFDLTNVVTTIGFHANPAFLDTKYKKDASQFDWDGGRDNVPSVNYFDANNTYTRTGFHSFAVINDSKYVPDSSLYTWKGISTESPVVNYFDRNNAFTSDGFHRFPSLLETKYIQDSSEFDWDGKPENAPAVNYFDQNFTYTNDGFHILAKPLDSQYVEESSRFDWDGAKDKSPETDFFDKNKKFTTVGFHRLAEFKITKYVPDSSEFTFKGKFPQIGINYFPDKNQPGFTLNIFPKTQSKNPKTEYLHETSDYTFEGSRSQKPANWFDVQKLNQGGFTQDIFPKTQSKNPETEYSYESSKFVWTGKFPTKPADWFDTNKLNQTGFTLNVMPKGQSKNPKTEYLHESSEYGFAGNLPTPVDFFDKDGSHQSGFTLNVQPKNASQQTATEYLTESSRFGWAGSYPKQPANFFDKGNVNTTGGFTMNIFTISGQRPLTTEYKHTSSEYTFTGIVPAGVNNFPDSDATGFTVNIFPKKAARPLTTEYIVDSIDRSSGFVSKGNRPQKPVNFFPDKNASGFTMDAFPKGGSKLPSQYDFNSIDPQFGWLGASGDFAPSFSYSNSKFQGETFGFLKKMTKQDGTTYPIISPRLRYSDNAAARLSIAAARLNSMNTDDNSLAIYAPDSLGPRPWYDGFRNTLSSTLTNQVPWTKTAAIISAWNKKYDTIVNINADSNSSLYTYSTTNNDKILKDQYGKPKWVEQNNRSKPSFVIIKSIGDRWDSIKERTDSDRDRMYGRINSLGIGSSNIFNRNLVELFKKSATADGKGGGRESYTRQFRLLSNPSNYGQFEIDNFSKDFGSYVKISDKSFLPIHGNGSDLDLYEDVALSMNVANEDLDIPKKPDERPNASNRWAYKKNRLIALMGEMLPNVLLPVNSNVSSGKYFAYADLSKDENGKIYRISNNDISIHRASHPYQPNKVYNTLGIDVTDASYPQSAKFHSYYGGAKKDKDGNSLGVGGSGGYDYSYSGKLRNLYDSVPDKDKKIDGMIMAISYLLGAKLPNDSSNYAFQGGKVDIQPDIQTKIENIKPFEPRYPSFSDRVRALVGTGGFSGTVKLEEKPPSEETPDIAPEKQYSVVAYSKLKKYAAGGSGGSSSSRSSRYNDFRHDIYNLSNTNTANGVVPGKFSSDPTIVDFANNNLQKKYGFGDHGKLKVDRSKPNVSNVEYGLGAIGGINAETKIKSGKEFRGDRINILDFRRKFAGPALTEDEIYETNLASNPDKSKDLVTFYFSSARIVPGGTVNSAAETIVFRATFDSITDNHKPSWNPIKYMGRGDPIYTYEGYERDVSFGFTVHIGSRDEMKATWRKLNYLASWTAPEYTGGGLMRAPICRLNIGHLYRKVPGFINSLSYTFDNVAGTWETAALKDDMNYSNADSKPGVLQLPKLINVSCGFTIFGVYRPEKNSVFYSLFDDTNSGNNGIVPKNNTSVNYFRTFDQGGGNNDDFVAIPLGLTDVPSSRQPVLTGNALATESAAQQALIQSELNDLLRTDGVDGAADYDGTGGTAGAPSDIRLKSDIKPIEYGINQVLKLNPVQYTMNSTQNGEVGFIAQEVRSIIPEVVNGTEGDIEKGEILTISYGHMVAVLTKAIQEQQEILEYQSDRIDRLEYVIQKMNEKNE